MSIFLYDCLSVYLFFFVYFFIFVCLPLSLYAAPMDSLYFLKKEQDNSLFIKSFSKPICLFIHRKYCINVYIFVDISGNNKYPCPVSRLNWSRHLYTSIFYKTKTIMPKYLVEISALWLYIIY